MHVFVAKVRDGLQCEDSRLHANRESLLHRPSGRPSASDLLEHTKPPTGSGTVTAHYQIIW